ncbi:MAG: ABC transporter ATP-binding protein [Aurantimonas coralicida]|jgi:branched-chain amino acid transport system ATP-binding protein|uniref:ABC transporter ATP-binding protein n=1 Tax=Aurantimonas TaxID=182269 RepID=UPI0003F9011C|nr:MULTISPECIES: ABC transporter ATP-binding protein [Aurantimonas]MCW7546017.1 ABC transporter ATP-binding protein [Aurantimonas litoralis]MBC6717563.1 ABC transporter ATP-binding protein [Aurantimonas sp. DM33-3]MCC4299092.1 ABC transporter ATP-binding protein [Aurantimonas coralicida]MDE0925424.1 ABC transporter ATP-binding protein [Aurantimonas coralicida]MDX1729801.1 ABC transporter ATP-binding protein [Aurantimonas coralicida]|tara:strand:- start:414 stop:1169 length:756 start_codon:yes stop_codon:yes gene_type:complete
MDILTINGVSKRFGGLKALDDVNLRVKEGTVHAIIGPNGAGKSTLLNTLVGRIVPDEGTVEFNGAPLLGHNPYEINQAGIARVFQTPETFAELTVMENVMIPAFARKDGAFKINLWGRANDRRVVLEEAEEILEDLNLAAQRHQRVDSMSRGDKRRLELAMCLVQRPKLLLLDEPTAGMSRADTNNTVDLLKAIAKRGITKVIIEHDMHVVFSLASTVSVMAQGTVIAEGTPEAIKADPRVQEAYLGGAHL